CAGEVSARRASGWDSRPSSAWRNRTAAASASDRLRERAAPSGSRSPVRTAPALNHPGRGLERLQVRQQVLDLALRQGVPARPPVTLVAACVGGRVVVYPWP